MEIEELDGRYEENLNILEEEVILGIDEAGRGPVLGHMVYACFYCSKKSEGLLKSLNVDDSKKLTDAERYRMRSSMIANKDVFGWRVHAISPKDLSAKMLRKARLSLNDISHLSAINLISNISQAGIKISNVYVDTVGTAETYQAKLSRLFPNIQFTVAEKADAIYPVVSAASIFAKTTRDDLLKEWKYEETVAVDAPGCGYPGDPVTRRFLETSFDQTFGFPNVVRFSWATAKDIIDKAGAKVNWYEDVSTAAKDTSQERISSFFATNNTNTKKTTHTKRVFTKRRIEGIVRL